LPHVAEEDVRAALEGEPKAIFRIASTIERLQPTQRDETSTALRAAVGDGSHDRGLPVYAVQALVAGGCDVGFHTLRHDPLPALSDDALRRALQEGRERLAAVVGRALDAVSYPYGKADERVARAARNAGYLAGFTTDRAAVTVNTDPLLIPRMPTALSTAKTALRVARAVASSATR
jgi:peptidoglycan/xylan/chitin deacetylase (PgdA/CDA1 family)